VKWSDPAFVFEFCLAAILRALPLGDVWRRIMLALSRDALTDGTMPSTLRAGGDAYSVRSPKRRMPDLEKMAYDSTEEEPDRCWSLRAWAFSFE